MKCRYCDYDMLAEWMDPKLTKRWPSLQQWVMDMHELGHEKECERILHLIRLEKYVSKKKLVQKIEEATR